MEIIREQHGGLKRVSSEYIESILEGETNYKVLLMLDGYDEYTPGKNNYIDIAIKSEIGNRFLIITSRPGEYLSQSLRNTMDGQIMIEGFSEENIVECSKKYFGSAEKSEKMLKQAKETGINELLRVPIMLVITVVIFNEENTLPKTKTKMYETIFRLTIDRTTLKTFGSKSKNITKLDDLLNTLGEFSLKALQKNSQELLLKRVSWDTKRWNWLKDNFWLVQTEFEPVYRIVQC